MNPYVAILLFQVVQYLTIGGMLLRGDNPTVIGWWLVWLGVFSMGAAFATWRAVRVIQRGN